MNYDVHMCNAKTPYICGEFEPIIYAGSDLKLTAPDQFQYKGSKFNSNSFKVDTYGRPKIYDAFGQHVRFGSNNQITTIIKYYGGIFEYTLDWDNPKGTYNERFGKTPGRYLKPENLTNHPRTYTKMSRHSHVSTSGETPYICGKFIPRIYEASSEMVLTAPDQFIINETDNKTYTDAFGQKVKFGQFDQIIVIIESPDGKTTEHKLNWGDSYADVNVNGSWKSLGGYWRPEEDGDFPQYAWKSWGGVHCKVPPIILKDWEQSEEYKQRQRSEYIYKYIKENHFRCIHMPTPTGRADFHPPSHYLHKMGAYQAYLHSQSGAKGVNKSCPYSDFADDQGRLKSDFYLIESGFTYIPCTKTSVPSEEEFDVPKKRSSITPTRALTSSEQEHLNILKRLSRLASSPEHIPTPEEQSPMNDLAGQSKDSKMERERQRHENSIKELTKPICSSYKTHSSVSDQSESCTPTPGDLPQTNATKRIGRESHEGQRPENSVKQLTTPTYLSTLVQSESRAPTPAEQAQAKATRGRGRGERGGQSRDYPVKQSTTPTHLSASVWAPTLAEQAQANATRGRGREERGGQWRQNSVNQSTTSTSLSASAQSGSRRAATPAERATANATRGRGREGRGSNYRA